MKYHPLADLFPPTAQEKRRELLEHMEKHGQIDPIVTYEGTILDGRARYECCVELGLAPVYREWSGEGGAPWKFVVGRNLESRNLTPSQRACIAVELTHWLQGGRASTRAAESRAEKAERRPDSRSDAAEATRTDRPACDDDRMSTTDRPPGPTMSDVLRQAIIDSGASHRSLFLATGVQRATIQRFVEGRTSIRLDLADRLAEHLGLELKRSRRWDRSTERP